VGVRASRSDDSALPTGTLAIGTGQYVFAVRADGTRGHALAFGDYPAYSRSGASVAFTRDGVWVAKSDGSRPRHVVPRFAEYLTYAAPTWSPDGTRVAYVRVDNLHGTSELWVVGADGSKRHGLAAVHFAAAPSWSPDGRWIAYTGDGGIAEVRADDSRRRLVIDRAAAAVAWSPDGAAIAFEERSGGFSSTWVLAMRTRALRRLEGHRGAPGPLAWSPDGRWIAFTTARPDAGGLFVTLHAVTARGGKPVEIATTYAQSVDGLSWR
jgi:Tol biopolymer transport system component